ncbi:monovalent cation/H+ antiporter subunit D family protein [Corynebacterium anserum]|uniref:Monovalent cation/H+ antiporter subunit D family protein n=1 Tax=Corynebacterium anserum TaxID=2684406 RepID=A0A7G7YQF1_9CORY|nr:monovalent cation/H+ antiporter subunit D family protein [Corynebacterium anserum]MBC2682407.1 monovalent cation/H+ antiporter subunit D family protein [Corynebacterium anserum]QNH96721.1 monovalent cation/H+ antiporter subunit D family protein [Corynebacterium anserum]
MTAGATLSFFILIPLLASACAAIVPSLAVRRFLGLAVPAVGILAAGYLLFYLSGEGGPVIADNVGAFIGGISIPLVADTLTAVMLLATSIVVCAAMWFADAVGETKTRFFPALALMLLAGAWGAIMTADIFNLFVFIEVMLMPSFGLLAMTGTWARLAAARMFIVVNLVTSMILLTGVATVYAVVGTTNLAALAGSAGPRGQSFAPGIFGNQWQLMVALGVVLLALSVKAGMAPVHTWLPRAYPATSPAVMALFSGLHTKVAVYAIFRIYLTAFEGDVALGWGILGFVVLGMLIGAFAGLGEASLRGVVAYQMVNGIPFMLVALVFLNHDAHLMLSASLFYMLHHMVVASSLIMAAGSIEETYGTGRIRPLSGLSRRDPFPSVIFALAALAIIGFPPFSGVLGKLGLIMGIAQDGTWKAWIAIGAIIIAGVGALLSMLYVWREVFWGRSMNANECDPSLAVAHRFVYPSAAMIILSVAMFFGAGPVFNVVGRAADNLTDTTAYVSAVMGDPDTAVGMVLEPGPSGLDNVPAGALDSTSEAALREQEIRNNQITTSDNTEQSKAKEAGR